MIKVILADDVPIMRRAISRLLKDCSEVELVAEADGYRGLMQLVVEHRPDVVIMDLHMPDEGEVSVAELKSCLDGCSLVVVSVWNDAATKACADAVGACLLLDKRLLAVELIPAIQQCVKV
jgi:DNA-binding NarL/FixJ family response regulator